MITLFKISTLCLAVLCCSCGAANKLKRAEKLIKEAEAKGAVWHVDTVYQKVPIFIDSVRVDSIFIAKAGDTVLIEKERLRVKIIRLPGDSIRVEAKCEADTVYKEVPITVTKTLTAKGGLDWKWLVVAFLAGAVVLFFVRR